MTPQNTASLSLADQFKPGALGTAMVLMGLCIAGASGTAQQFITNGWSDIGASLAAGLVYGPLRLSFIHPLLERVQRNGGKGQLWVGLLDAALVAGVAALVLSIRPA